MGRVLTLLLLLALGRPSLVQADLAQTAATCTSDYAWMGTSKGVSPCQVAASLNALCNNGNWQIPALNASVHYTNPSAAANTSTLCTCSWASYNLISACTACQGFASQIAFWSDYSSDCTGKTSNTYWPSKIAISTDITIPYWASKDPTVWTTQKFNPDEAKNLTGYANLSPGAPSSPSSTDSNPPPIAAIVGAVIGGLVAIVAFGLVLIFLIRRHRQRLAASGQLGSSRFEHLRTISDTTVESGFVSVNSGSPLVQRSTSHHDHNINSASSFPYFQSSRVTTPRRQEALTRPAEAITPYRLPPTNGNNPDRKQLNCEWPVFEQPTAPVLRNSVRMEVSPSVQTVSRKQARHNPPAYSEADPTTPPPISMSPHHAQESFDSLMMMTTPDSSQGSTPARPTHMPGNTGSGMSFGHQHHQQHMPISGRLRTSAGAMHKSISTTRTNVGGGAVSPSRPGGGHGLTFVSVRSGSRELRHQTLASINPSDIA